MTSRGATANLIVAGVAKAGTTSLFGYLAQHREICGAAVKETQYFTPLRRPGGRLAPIEDYSQHFRACGTEKYRLESTPNYFYGGPPLIAGLTSVLDAPRIIIALREPCARLVSTYRYARSRGRIPADLDFAAYLGRSRALSSAASSWSESDRPYRTYTTNFYSWYVRHWLDAFAQDLRIVFFEDLVADPPHLMAALLDWLQVDTSVANGLDYEARNRTRDVRSVHLRRAATRTARIGEPLLRAAPALKKGLRRLHDAVNRGPEANPVSEHILMELREEYAEANAQLAALLRGRGYRSFPAWLDRF